VHCKPNLMSVLKTSSTKTTVFIQDGPNVTLSRAMRASYIKEDYIDTFDMFNDILDYLPQGWVPVPMRVGTRKNGIYIFHETDPFNYFYYNHVNYMVGENRLSITSPHLYYSDLEDACGMQPSYKHRDDVRVEIFLTKDFFDFFWSENKSIKDYIGLFSAFYFDLGECMVIYDHKKRKYDVDGVAIKGSRSVLNVTIGEFGQILSDTFQKTNELLLAKMHLIVYSEVDKIDDKKPKLEKAPICTEVPGLYDNGILMVKESCTNCLSYGATFQGALKFKKECHWQYDKQDLVPQNREKDVLIDGSVDIYALTYGTAMNYLVTYIYHKYHDKSTAMSTTLQTLH
jgi:hypothetical protein